MVEHYRKRYKGLKLFLHAQEKYQKVIFGFIDTQNLNKILLNNMPLIIYLIHYFIKFNTI